MKKPAVAVEFARRAVCAMVIGSLLLGAAQELGSETLVMTATYPSPVGIYARLITTGGTGNLHTILSRNASSVVIGANGPNAGAKFDVEGSGYVLLNSGNVGIGVTLPGSTLSVNGNAAIGSGYAAAGAPSNGAIIQGSVGIGTAGPTAALDVQGPVRFRTGAVNNYVLTSDWSGNARWKAPSGGVSITAGNAGIIVSPSPLTGTGTISLATQGCPSGQALQSIGGTYSCVSVSGGSSGITSVNGMTGPAISIAAGSGISISNSANTVTITNTGGGGGGGGGTVTSISQGGGISLSPNPITGSGTVSLATQSCPAGQFVTSIGGTIACTTLGTALSSCTNYSYSTPSGPAATFYCPAGTYLLSGGCDNSGSPVWGFHPVGNNGWYCYSPSLPQTVTLLCCS